jgi:hypothetical protein
MLMLGSEPVVGQTVEFPLDPPVGRKWSSQVELVLSIASDPASEQPAYVHREVSTRRQRLTEEAGEQWVLFQVERVS